MSILSSAPSDGLQDLWVEVYAKISKQYDTRRIVVDYTLNFNDGTRKNESYDISMGAMMTKWNSTVDEITHRCIETILFSVQVFTTYYGRTIEKIVIK